VFALDPNQPLAQLHHTTWTAKDGVYGAVYALAQTSDGYLWVGTTDGLLRFDGISFEKYKPEHNELLSSSISTLLATPDGSLWIGYMSGGATHLKHGDATNYPPGKEFPMGFVRHFIQDRDGKMWAAAAGGLVSLEGGTWRKIGQEWNYPAKSAWAMLVDRDGTMWVAAENRIVYLTRGEKKFRDFGIHTGPVYSFTHLPDGTYISTTMPTIGRLCQPSARRSTVEPVRSRTFGMLREIS
jgi:ligand-binding sensor domain-containing protein